jgi:hypothetical protein
VSTKRNLVLAVCCSEPVSPAGSCIARSLSAYRMKTDRCANKLQNFSPVQLVHQMLGFDIEQSALNVSDPVSPFGPDGRTAPDLLNSLKSERSSISDLLRETVHLQNQMTPQDWIGYLDRMKLLGEPNATEWLRSKYGSSSP